MSLEQIQEIGATRQQIRTRLDRGQWQQADPAVIRIAGVPATWKTEVLTAVLAAGKGALASHRTAARLWGLDTIRSEVVEITIPRGRRFRRPGVIAHQSTDLDRTTATVIDGIPTTLVARTLLDLGAVVPTKLVLLAVDEARRKRLTNWRVLLDCLGVHARRGRDGSGSLRTVLEDHYGEMAKTDSGFERLVMVALAEAGMPRPALQHEVTIDGRRYRIDLAYPDERVAIELDGRVHLSEKVWHADHRRQNDLVNAGWTVLRFTWRDYKDERTRLVDAIARALRQNRDRN